MSIFGSKKSRIVKLWLLFVCCLCLLTLPVFAGDTADVWDGTVAKPTKLVEKDGVYYYEISTCEQLAYVAQTGGDWLTYNYLLVNDLILNETTPEWDEEGNCLNIGLLQSWKPIGCFTGVLDGKGYAIDGLYCSAESYAGLFTHTKNAEIQNLSLKNSYVCAGDDMTAGGLIGHAYDSTIVNCSFVGFATGGDCVGGLVGIAERSILQCCFASGTVYGGTAGGLVGHGGTILDCVSHCDVVAVDTLMGDGSAGGLVGRNDNANENIENSHATGNVIGTTAAGGLVGEIRKVTIKNSYAIGDVTGIECAGGLVGYSGGNEKITASYATGDVIATNGCAGGLIGEVKAYQSLIEDCYSIGDVSSITYTGSFIGRYSNAYTGTYPNGIFNCYSTGAVLSGESRGGFLGEDRRIWGEKFSIENCYFLRDVGINEDLFGTSIATADAANEVEGKTLAQMQQQNTFTGWDFGTVWAIDSDENNGLPYLWLRDGEEDIVPLPEYSISGIQPRDASGKKLNKLPKDDFLVTISLKKLVEDSDALVLLACYTDDGQYQGLLYVSVKGMSKNAELELTLPVSNQTGKIKKLTAFTVASFGDMTPLGEAVTFE